MTTHNSINAIQLIPFRSRSLYPNDYWKAPTNRKFKFNHPKLNKPPIFPEIHSFPVLTNTSYITSHLHYKSEGLLSLISNRLSNTVNSTSYMPWLVVGVCPLTSRVSCAPSPQSISHHRTTLRTDSLPSTLRATWEQRPSNLSIPARSMISGTKQVQQMSAECTDSLTVTSYL